MTLNPEPIVDRAGPVRPGGGQRHGIGDWFSPADAPCASQQEERGTAGIGDCHYLTSDPHRAFYGRAAEPQPAAPPAPPGVAPLTDRPEHHAPAFEIAE